MKCLIDENHFHCLKVLSLQQLTKEGQSIRNLYTNPSVDDDVDFSSGVNTDYLASTFKLREIKIGIGLL